MCTYGAITYTYTWVCSTFRADSCTARITFIGIHIYSMYSPLSSPNSSHLYRYVLPTHLSITPSTVCIPMCLPPSTRLPSTDKPPSPAPSNKHISDTKPTPYHHDNTPSLPPRTPFPRRADQRVRVLVAKRGALVRLGWKGKEGLGWGERYRMGGWMVCTCVCREEGWLDKWAGR